MREVAIVGLGGSYADFIASRVNSKTFTETWGINCIGAIIHVDRTIMMDPASRFIDTANAGSQTDIAREFLKKNNKPIYSCELDKRVKSIIKYPLKDVVKSTGFCYFNNTVPYAMALAIHEKFDKIHLFGIDYSYSHNLHMAESGRACTEFWCAVAINKGIKIEIANRSNLLDNNVPDTEKLYGYHRLSDPLVQYIENGTMQVTRQSKLTSPEPKQEIPILFGRHDNV